MGWYEGEVGASDGTCDEDRVTGSDRIREGTITGDMEVVEGRRETLDWVLDRL